MAKKKVTKKTVSNGHKPAAKAANAAPAPKAAKEPKEPKKAAPNEADLTALKKKAEEAKTELVRATNEANALRLQAKSVEGVARKTYAEAVAPYREVCRKAGIECEYAGHRAANVSEKVAFLVEKVDKGLKVVIKGKPGTEEVIPTAALKESINKAAYAYTDKHIGPKEEVGNKGGSLSNRLRAALAAK